MTTIQSSIDFLKRTIFKSPYETRIKIKNKLKNILILYSIFDKKILNIFFLENDIDYKKIINNFYDDTSVTGNVDDINNREALLKKIDFYLLPYKYFNILYFFNKINYIVDYYNYIQTKWKTNYKEVEHHINTIFNDSLEYDDIYECVFDYFYTYLINKKNTSPSTPIISTASPSTPIISTASPSTPIISTASPSTPIISSFLSNYEEKFKEFKDILTKKQRNKFVLFAYDRYKTYDILSDIDSLVELSEDIMEKYGYTYDDLHYDKINALEECFNFILKEKADDTDEGESEHTVFIYYEKKNGKYKIKNTIFRQHL